MGRSPIPFSACAAASAFGKDPRLTEIAEMSDCGIYGERLAKVFHLETAPAARIGLQVAQQAFDYWRDARQRSALLLEVMIAGHPLELAGSKEER